MNLKDWREANGKSQKWLEDATGIAQTQISRYENGARPDVPNARKIEVATAGAVTLDDWYPKAQTEGK